jgi:nitrate/nitrite transporter NarK
MFFTIKITLILLYYSLNKKNKHNFGPWSWLPFFTFFFLFLLFLDRGEGQIYHLIFK